MVAEYIPPGVQIITSFNRDPTSDDVGYSIGSLWLNTAHGTLWVNVNTAESPFWVQIGALGESIVVSGSVAAANDFGSANLSAQGEGSGGLVSANVAIIEGVPDGVTSYLVSVRRGPITDGDAGGDSWGVKLHGHEYLVALDAIPDDDVNTSERAQWFDDSVGAPAARFKERDAAGTLYTGRSVGISDAGVLDLSGLPTSDPHVAGHVWNNAGTLKVSAG